MMSHPPNKRALVPVHMHKQQRIDSTGGGSIFEDLNQEHKLSGLG